MAEDNPVNRRVVALMLERRGYRADIVGNGLEAVEAVRRRPYDLVLMDCQMPEMDGYEATRAIRQGEAAGGRRVPVIALTANALPGDRERCVEAGMDDYLAKPVTMKALAVALERWMAPRR